MIRIRRPPNGPAVLLTKGVARQREHEADIKRNLRAFASGSAKLNFDRAVYAHVSVKKRLIAMQHRKCAFCEAKPLHVSNGDVEHFRPKAAVRQSDSGSLGRPGYYWLAYEWKNLLFACERCNRRHKKDLFPLIDPSRRAKSRQTPLANETPVFIDPSAEDPELYITYRDHVPVAIDGNRRGKQTIKALGLHRPDLNADREKHLANVQILHQAATLPGVSARLRNKSRRLLTVLVASDAEYSSMTRVAVEALGGLPRSPARRPRGPGRGRSRRRRRRRGRGGSWRPDRRRRRRCSPGRSGR